MFKLIRYIKLVLSDILEGIIEARKTRAVRYLSKK